MDQTLPVAGGDCFKHLLGDALDGHRVKLAMVGVHVPDESTSSRSEASRRFGDHRRRSLLEILLHEFKDEAELAVFGLDIKKPVTSTQSR